MVSSNCCWVLLLLLFVSSAQAQKISLIDSDASRETKKLFKSLHKLAKKHTLFAHQHATEYGHGWYGDENRSDVKSVCGSHPAMIGVDFSDFSGHSLREIEEAKRRLLKNVQDTYNRGGVTTVAWHFSNPVSPGSFYWKDSVSLPAVKYIIPGGAAHDDYKDILDGIGVWAKSLRGEDGKVIPLIFRPYHEFDGGWFWWGKPRCTAEEFVSLWRFTVSYLRDSLQVHNLIYAFSPDNNFKSEEEYLERYPGNKWVDLVGMDNYAEFGRDTLDIEGAAKKIKIVDDFAKQHGKLAALTETGLESISDPTWWTETLLRVMQRYDMNLAYVLVWRNDPKSLTHYYAPFPGHSCVPNFMTFFRNPYTLFENDLPDLYGKKKKFRKNK